MKKVTSNNSKQREYESAIMLVERQIKNPDGKEPQKISTIDVIVLLDEFKEDSQRINELAREIAKMNGRSIITYEDAEEAIKLIKTGKEHNKRVIKRN